MSLWTRLVFYANNIHCIKLGVISVCFGSVGIMLANPVLHLILPIETSQVF